MTHTGDPSDTPRIEAVVIDWAGTITIPMIDMLLASAAELGFSADDLPKVFAGLAGYHDDPDSVVHRAERGEIDDDTLRAHLDGFAEGAGQIFDADPPSFFHAADRPEMIELLEDLAETDVLAVLATNNFVTGHEILASRYLDRGLVSAIVNSALVGLRKPDPAFFGLIAETFDLDPATMLVVDDQERNLEVARDLGMATVLVGPDTAAAVAEIRRLTLSDR